MADWCARGADATIDGVEGGYVDRAVRRVASVLTYGVVLLAGALAAALLTPAPVHAVTGDVVVTQSDPAGDVKLIGKRGPGLVARRSVDLREFTLVSQKTGVRLSVELARVLANNKRFDQRVEIQMQPTVDSGGTWFLDVAMSGKEPESSVATWSPTLDAVQNVTCDDGATTSSDHRVTTTVDPDADTLSIFVPDVCLPTDVAKIKVFSSLTGAKGRGFSLDKMRIRGAYPMHP